jgi:drug/metabolite transporter (DMT)-like permease
VLIGAIYAVVSQPYIRRNPSLPVAAFAILIGAAGLFALVLAQGNLASLWSFRGASWLAVLWLIGPAGVIPFYLWNWALERAPPSRVTIAITLNPLAAAAFGAAVLGEAVTLNLLGGLILVVAGIAFANRQARA